MEFVITKYAYYLPFKTNNGENQGVRREHITLNGVFLGRMESPNSSTRELVENIKVGHENTTTIFNVYVASDEELAKLNKFEDSIYINTTINLKSTENNLAISGAIYLSQKSFDEIKALISVAPNSNSYFSFETIVHGDKAVATKPLEIDFHCNTSGVKITFPIQQVKNSS